MKVWCYWSAWLLNLQSHASKILRQLHGIFDLLCGSRRLSWSDHVNPWRIGQTPQATRSLEIEMELANRQTLPLCEMCFWHPLYALKSKVQFSHCFHLLWSGDACLGCDTLHVNYPAAWDIHKRWLDVGVRELWPCAATYWSWPLMSEVLSNFQVPEIEKLWVWFTITQRSF